MTYKEYKESTIARNPELRKEYEALTVQYDTIDAVIAARTEKKMTQAELAECADTKQSNISSFESGYRVSAKDIRSIR